MQRNNFSFGFTASSATSARSNNRPPGIGKTGAFGAGRAQLNRVRQREVDQEQQHPNHQRRKIQRLDDDDDNDLEEDEKAFDEEEDEDEESKVHNSLAEPSGINEDEEDDPLDAFMAGISDKVKEDSAKEADKPKLRRNDIEEEDEIESYVNHMKKKGVVIGKMNQGFDRANRNDDTVNSDDEVYAAAARADAGLGYGSDEENAKAKEKRRDVEPLAPFDHDSFSYPEIGKCFYEVHPDIAALSEERVQEIRKQLDMKVSGSDVPSPAISFAHFGFDDALINVIARNGFSEPTGIQRQAIPAALSGRDLIGIAKTGSGKTAAFLWPMMVHMMDQEPLAPKGDGPIGLVLAPTRELAHQIYIEAKRFGKAYGLKAAVVYGGANKMEQFKELRAGNVEILVATPGRLIDMIKMKATNLRRVSFLVLDEADRMFDLGFEPQVRSICDNVRPDRQTLLFSATFQKRVERLAREVTICPVRISVGEVGQANEDVTQIVHVLPDDSYKWDWLVKRLAKFVTEGAVIVFVARKDGVDALAENLKANGFDCAPLHGDIPQCDRDKAIRDFRHNRFPILVSTDVAARGLDIKAVKNVVNYDAARDIDAHTHRVGRTGRAGEKGTAHVLITSKEDKFAAELTKNFEGSGLTVTPELMALAMQNSRFKKSRQYRDGRTRGRGRGRGRGGIGYTGSQREIEHREAVPPQQRYRPGLGHSNTSRSATSANATPLVSGGRFGTMNFQKVNDLTSTFAGSIPAPPPVLPTRAPLVSDGSREAERARAVAEGAAKAAALASRFAAQFGAGSGGNGLGNS